MSGVAKTMDEAEEKARKPARTGLLPGSEILGSAGEVKHQYAEKRGFDTTDEGYYAAKEKHKSAEAEKAAIAAQVQADAAAKAKSDSELAAATEKSHAAQRAVLRRKGRRASILTSGQGTDQLGVPG